MDESKEFELQQLLDISQKMLLSAKSNDWESLPDLEAERKKAMNTFFEKKSSGYLSDYSKKVEQTIKDVLLINEQIEQIAQHEKVTIAQQLQGLKKKQNVHSAYLQNK